jgi:hypothetical protein
MTDLATIDNTPGNGHNRRRFLRRGFVLAAGAFGVTAAGEQASAATRAVPNELRLYGRNWRLATPGRKAGVVPQAGDYGAVYGELLDGPNGKALGEFFGSRLAVQSAPGGFKRGDASVEVHTFVLQLGTIVGMGTAVLGDAVFAIVGGTGKYAGVTGSYVAHQRLHEQGGNGTAEFILTLHRLEA